MSNKKEEISLDINTELSDDEYEDFDETLSDNDNIEDVEGDVDEEEENELGDDEENDETIQESEIEDIDDSKNKSNFEESNSKSEIDKDVLSDVFLDDDLEDLDDFEDDDINIINPDDEINENLQVNDEDRISRNILTKYEMVRLIGTRAKQISDGSKVFVKYDGVKSAIELAELELKYKMLPLKIKRPLPNGKYEIWKVSELDIIDNI